MKMLRYTIAALVCLLTVAPSSTLAQRPPDMEANMSAQREALKKLDYLDGTWRGSTSLTTPTGEQFQFTQTERVGPFLDGTVKIIEGKGYSADGSVVFNALGIVSYDPASQSYSIRTYTMGQAGDYPLTLTEGGFRWEIPAGPATIRYDATLEGDTWKETGYRIAPGREPVPFIEMTLTRIGDTDWPAGGAVSPR